MYREKGDMVGCTEYGRRMKKGRGTRARKNGKGRGKGEKRI